VISCEPIPIFNTDVPIRIPDIAFHPHNTAALNTDRDLCWTHILLIPIPPMPMHLDITLLPNKSFLSPSRGRSANFGFEPITKNIIPYVTSFRSDPIKICLFICCFVLPTFRGKKKYGFGLPSIVPQRVWRINFLGTLNVGESEKMIRSISHIYM